MPYLGVAPNPRENREVDDISGSFNGSTTAFTLQAGGSNVSPGKDTAIIVSLGGVIQNPGTDYTIAASTITFTTAPASGLSFFGVVLAQSIDIETVADNTVTTAKIVDGAVTNAKVNNSAAIAVSKLANFVTNNADNRVITGSGTANTLNGESNLTVGAQGDLHIKDSGNTSYLGFTGATDAGIIIGNGLLDSAGVQIRTSTSGSCKVNFGDGDGSSPDRSRGFVHYTHSDNSMQIGVNSSERMRIDSSGNVGIGTTSPEGELDLGSSTSGRKLTFNSYSNIFSEHSSGALWFASNFYGNAGASGFKTGFTGNFGAAAISVNATGGSSSSGIIEFFTDASASKNFGAAFTPSERMRIDSSGRVMINTTTLSLSKAPMLEVKSDSNTADDFVAMFSANNATAAIGISYNQIDAFDGSNTANLHLLTNGTERMRIDNLGRVFIGTTSGSEQLRIEATANTRVPMAINDSTNTSTFTHRLMFQTGNTEVGRIRSSSNATTYDTSISDVTLKKNFEDWTENTLNLFKNINPQKYNFIQEDDGTTKSKGFIAQEMVDSFPEAYSKEDKEDSKYYFNPSGMVVYLMKAIQELEAKVAALEAA